MATAESSYNAFFGFALVSSMPEFFEYVISIAERHRFLAESCAAGPMFAIVAFSISVVSFAAQIERDASAPDAILTSLRLIARNPPTNGALGISLRRSARCRNRSKFSRTGCGHAGIGHATWHLYRKAVSCA